MRAALTGRPVFHVDIKLAADQRLNAGFHGLDRKLKCAEQVVCVRDRKRRLLIGKRALDQRLDRQRPLEKRVGGMHAQMYKARPFTDGPSLAIFARGRLILGLRRGS